jgi:hypothetical protein
VVLVDVVALVALDLATPHTWSAPEVQRYSCISRDA